jgi:phosphatidylglycerol---prolipoprotein diacylglyceryl transferase
MAINFPNIEPIALQIGPLVIRWYALAYIAGLFGGLKYVETLLSKRPALAMPFFDTKSLDSLFNFVAFGVIFGGRLGYVLFYKPSYYFGNPENILKLWQGGMSFHGGLLGVIIAIIIFAYRRTFNPLVIGDYVCAGVPIGLFFGRIANFINAELYGRVTDVAWAVRFPAIDGINGYTEPRHPSQIYEALTEGLLLFIILHLTLYYTKALTKRGFATGLFLAGYATARIFSEFFRQPDAFLGFVLTAGGAGITQGMMLSIPMLLIGLWLIITAHKTQTINV